MEITRHPDFINAHRDGYARARYTFTATGSKQAGTLYVTRTLNGADAMTEMPKAASIAAKRAGADTVMLWRID